LEERLRHTLGLVNEWLRYAEAKNAVLVAANGATIVGVLQTAGSLDQLHLAWRIYLYNLVALAAVALLLGLTSFLPTVDFGRVMPKGAKKAGDNLFFFGAAARFSPEYYLHQYYQSHGTSMPAVAPEHEVMYANQIVVNSRITLWKMNRFKAAAWVSACAFLTPPMALIAWWVDRHTRVEQLADGSTTPRLPPRSNR
jgi:hypothetical protein